MRTRFLAVAALVIWFAPLAQAQTEAQPQAESQTPVIPGVTWQEGPSVGNLGPTAQLQVPEGFVFAGPKDTRTIMEVMQNPTSGAELGFVAPADLNWFVVFEFDDLGYVKDDEKGSLDADAMLQSIRKGNEEANKERQKRNWPAVTILGWEQKPQYDPATHNLEWALRAESESGPVINYNTRLLGRAGVMRVNLVTDPDVLAAALPTFKTVLTGFQFSPGQKYSEFKSGDKLAKYGLTALVVGGATAVAFKAGIFKWLWKVLVVAGAGIAAFFRKIFSRKKAQQSAP